MEDEKEGGSVPHSQKAPFPTTYDHLLQPGKEEAGYPPHRTQNVWRFVDVSFVETREHSG